MSMEHRSTPGRLPNEHNGEPVPGQGQELPVTGARFQHDEPVDVAGARKGQEVGAGGPLLHGIDHEPEVVLMDDLHQAIDKARDDGVTSQVVICLGIHKSDVLRFAPGKGLPGGIRKVAQVSRRFQDPRPCSGADLCVRDFVQHEGNGGA